MIMKKLLLTIAAIVLATPAYAVKCNDPAVISMFKDAYICDTIVNCKSLGIKDFAELQSLDDDQIKQRFEALPAQVSAKRQVATAAANEAVAEILRNTISIAERGIIASKHLIASIDVAPTDYNVNIKKYTCEADLKFDDESLTSVMYFMANASLMQKNATILTAAALSTNNQSVYQGYLNAQLKPMVAMMLPHVSSTLTYTVQASDIEKTDDPEFLFKLKTEWVQ
jgi:hypothetical protein